MTRFCFIAFLTLAVTKAQSQEVPPATQQQLEQLAEATEEEPDEALLLQLEAWRQRPLNLNVATVADLQAFPFLTALHIDHFIRYRSLLGPLLDLHELQAVPGWDVAVVRQVLPFVTLSTTVPNAAAILNNIQFSGNNMLQLRWSRTLQKAKGYDPANESGFAGDRNALLLRYLYRQPKLQYGLVAEKDAGEALFKKGRASPDFLSAHLFWRGSRRIKAVAIGDFTVNLGQGLIHWQAIAFGKSTEVLSIKRQGAPLRPYASAGEAYFLRGAGITWGRGAVEATFFAAQQKLNANVSPNEWGDKVISSFSPGGLHRTATEYADRWAARQTAAGGSVVYRKTLFHAGINGILHCYSLPIQKRDEPYNLYALRGKQFFAMSGDYGFSHRNLHLFGEVAVDYKGRPAVVQGALLSVHPMVDVSALGRFIHRGYAAVSANAFTESANTTAEQGLYLGLQWRPSARIRISTYADLFRFSWLRFRTDAPGYGSEYLFQILIKPDKKTEAYLLLRSEEKPVNTLLPQAFMRQIIQKQRHSARLQWSKEVSAGWLVRSRAEVIRVVGDSALNGFLLFAEAHYKPSSKLGVDARVAYFNTEGFDSRIYTYENDVLYGYSIPALYGSGLRAYGNLRLQLDKNSVAWVRLAHSFFGGEQSIGSGLMAIDGNSRTELRLQFILNF